MSMNIVQSKRNLKRRVEGFFASEKDERQAASNFIEALSMHAHVYIFGGMIRDIGLFGHNGFSSDIDLVFHGSRHKLYQALESLNIPHFTENKFGGFRLTHSRMDYDIWSLEDTWAFREDVISLHNIDSLLHTTLMTWDAVIYDINAKKIITQPNYFQDLINRRLDLVLEKNPNEKGSVVKIIRTIYGKNAATLGGKLCAFLKNHLSCYSSTELIQYERANFDKNLITAARIDKLLILLEQWQKGEDIIINVQQKPKTIHYKCITEKGNVFP
ncbi:hypothetical protein GJV07_00240 [Enterobacteriaceae bacterium RIT711]|nr:hypothetical protein [Enterobacteriaceae bacterium RIT711]